MSNMQRQRGISLVEILVAMAIGLFLLVGLFSIFYTTRQTYTAQQGLANLQDNERMAAIMLSNVIKIAGYFPNPQAQTAVQVFGANQIVSGTGNGSGDTITVRYATAPGDGIMNCNGGSNTGAANVVWTNTFSLDTTTHTLECDIGNGPQPLVTGVQSMQILYGVDTGSGFPAIYVNASSMGAYSWSNVKSVLVRLTFINPVQGQTNALQPFSLTIPLMNRL